MGPLAARTYLFRNAGKTLPLVGVIVLAVMLISGIVTLINSIPLSVRTIYQYMKVMMVVTPRGDANLTEELRREIPREAPVPIGRMATVRGSEFEVRSIVGRWQFALAALNRGDAQFFLDRLGVERVDGRLPNPGEPEAVLSEPLARNLGLKIGDVLLSPENPDAYSPMSVKVVGIARTNQWIALGDLDYYRANHFPPIDLLLVFAKDPADQPRLDAWGYDRYKGERARVLVYADVEKSSREMFQTLYRILDVVIGTLVVVITVMMGMLINIHLTQRTQEFGLLQALGYTKRQLIGRVATETVAVVALGWILGAVVAFGMLNVVDRVLMYPNAYALDVLDPTALRYTIPVPLAILAAAIGTLVLKFRGFDPVGVVERRLV